MVTEKIKRLVQEELAGLNDSFLRERIAALLIDPKPIMRDWDYGEPGEQLLCWTVLEHLGTGVGIAYCEQGFGPRCPWGLVWLRPNMPASIGEDSGWFSTFIDAVFDAMFIDDLRS